MTKKSLRDERKSLALFLLAFIAYAFVYMTKNCYSAAMAAIVDEGIMTKSETGLIAAVFYLVYAPFQVVGGVAADKLSPGKLISFGMLGAGICNLLIYFIHNYVAMIVIWAANAVFQFGIWPAIFKIVSTELAEEHRMNGVFYISFASPLGLVLSYGFAIFISDWELNFLISAVVLFVLTAVFYIVYRDSEKHMVEQTPVLQKTEAVREKKSGGEVFALLMRAGIPIIMIVETVESFINLGVKSLVPVMLMESYESVTPAIANALNIILVIAGPIGLVLTRLPIFKKIRPTTGIAILLATMLLPLAVIALVGKIHIAAVVAALAFLMIVAGGVSIFFFYIAKKFDKFGCTGTVSGIINCMSAIGIVLANYVFASLADGMGWSVTTAAWLIITAAAVILAVILLPIWKRFTKKEGIE